MPCYYPIAAVQPFPGAPLQLFKREQIHLRDAIHGKKLEVPCNQCSGCRRRQSLEWAVRCVHEAQTHEHNAYITLTYNDKHLPANLSLQHRDFVLFMKKLRNAAFSASMGNESQLMIGSNTTTQNYSSSGPTLEQPYSSQHREEHARTTLWETIRKINTPPEIRFYMAGEYGELYGRPHYHSLLFGVDFRDKVYHGKTKAGEKIYLSETLNNLWGKGYTSIGRVTFNSAAYISRYVMKKQTGDGNKQNYEITDLETGEIIIQKKEYNCMSRATGIGKKWLTQFSPDIYTRDKVITKQGRELRPPRYYDKQYKRMDKAHLEHLKHARELEALAHIADHTTERLRVQETVANAKHRFQTRNLE